MKENPLVKVKAFGQSIWIDYIRRQMITSGELQQLIDQDGLSGMTSNPSIFQKAISGSRDYDYDIRAMALEGRSIEEIYQALTVEDVQQAADLFRPVYQKSEGRDGFVSLEVNPHLAHDTHATISEARRLWATLDRPNVFIKVPATLEGLPAIKELISEGININVTLLFGLPRYRKVAEAYIAGLEKRASKGQSLERVASVASFFLSRIDVLIDPMLEKIMHRGGPEAEIAARLRGQVAIASAKEAYQIYKEIFATERFQNLARQGARTQRVLWASTSTKNPDYPDVKYVEPLIGSDTVNTLPQETINAYRDHGNPGPSLEREAHESRDVLRLLDQVGIDIDQITQQLEDEGVRKFNEPYDNLMHTLKKKRAAALRGPVNRQMVDLGEFDKVFQDRLTLLEEQQFCTRLWRKDPSLWTNDPMGQEAIRNKLGWLHVAEKMEQNLEELSQFCAEVKEAGFRHVVHMGMGGSSLAPLVFQHTFGPAKNGLHLTILDTTDPATIRAIEKRLSLKETLFIVASKSGTTAEAMAFCEYFYQKVKGLKGDLAGENFLAITDPGTSLVKLAQERSFRRVFQNFTDIGGRYSALSYFGIVPAALMGLDVAELLARSLRMSHACSSCVPVRKSPGIVLGAVLGELALHGRDKVTFLVPEAMSTLGMWLEQLLAESTGKEGTGVLPVAGEGVGDPSLYGHDRLFVYIRLKHEVDQHLERSVEGLRKAGQPVVTIEMEDQTDLSQEFFRWEIATATAGSILSINPFDQPNVQESKNNTNRLLKSVFEEGRLPEERPILVEGPLSLYAEDGSTTLTDTLTRFFKQTSSGNYVALLAYFTEETDNNLALQDIRLQLRDRLHLATTVGYGPRYLHSTGQLHKGGRNTGFFLQLTGDDDYDLPVPGKPYTFGVLKQAQALGDLEALRQHGRPVLRIHLGSDVGQGLVRLKEVVQSALAADRS